MTPEPPHHPCPPRPLASSRGQLPSTATLDALLVTGVGCLGRNRTLSPLLSALLEVAFGRNDPGARQVLCLPPSRTGPEGSGTWGTEGAALGTLWGKAAARPQGASLLTGSRPWPGPCRCPRGGVARTAPLTLPSVAWASHLPGCVQTHLSQGPAPSQTPSTPCLPPGRAGLGPPLLATCRRRVGRDGPVWADSTTPCGGLCSWAP